MKKMILDVRLNEYATRAENPNVPWSVEEIVEDALECAQAGASAVHFHGRDGATGAPNNATSYYQEVIRGIRESSDVLVHTTLGYVTQPPEARIRHIAALAADPATRPDIAPVDMVSINVDVYNEKENRFETTDQVFENPTNRLIQFTRELTEMGIKTIHTCWNTQGSRTVDAFIRMGLIQGPAYVALLMSESGMYAGHPGNLRGLISHLDFMPKSGPVEWIAGCYPGSVLPVATAVIAEGGHLTLGLGDYPFPEFGKPRNSDIVRFIVDLAHKMGREIASPSEAREILGMQA